MIKRIGLFVAFVFLMGVPAMAAHHESGDMEHCGGDAHATCHDGHSFCEFKGGTCGAHNEEGMCMKKPEKCTKENHPVCGCDGHTYGNSCEAHRAGVSVEHDGACDGSEHGDGHH